MDKRDYYEILGIDRGADENAIKKEYRGLAMKYHPDRNPGDKQAAEKMTEINEAYAVLSDRGKRRLYDTYGHAGLQGYTIEDIFGGVDFSSLFREFGLGDSFGRGFGGSIFDSFFGRRGSTRTRPRKGADLRYDLEVSLEDVALGAEKTIQFPKIEECRACSGTGAKPDGLIECEHCHGSGQIVMDQRSGYTVLRQITTCSHCRGRGRIIKESCDECQGIGFLEKAKEITVPIPRGADTGHNIRIEGEGKWGEAGARPGDLYVVFAVQRHPVFERHGDDVYVAKEVSFTQATLGTEIEDVPGLEGKLKLEIPEGTQTGAVFRIANKGIAHLNDYGRGDEYVVVKVATPTNLSPEEKKLLREFEKLRQKSQALRDEQDRRS